MSAPELEEEREASPSAGPARRVTWRKLTVRPGFLVALLLGTWLWFGQAGLDPVSAEALSGGRVPQALWRHVELTLLATLFVLVIAIPLSVLLVRPVFPRARPVVLFLSTRRGAAPAIGLLALPLIWLGTGVRAALAGMVACAILPVLSRTLTGVRAGDPAPTEAAHEAGTAPTRALTRFALPLTGVRAGDPATTEAAREAGTAPTRALTRVALPLAAPLILAAVRTALVLNVATATPAAFAGAGGLGVLIRTGLTAHRTPVLVLGAILTLALALLLDWLASLAELLPEPRGVGARGVEERGASV
ncbi:ABC transporter permease subunit [Streptomyces sp. NPDC000345]|uniref:ABC transporter permease subunit n=1 Tax=Streptomyces sp. NPDC000345 TaxID=3364537 RepID=UPI0036C37E9B